LRFLLALEAFLVVVYEIVLVLVLNVAHVLNDLAIWPFSIDDPMGSGGSNWL
jgi:hypothetical protein